MNDSEKFQELLNLYLDYRNGQLTLGEYNEKTFALWQTFEETK